MFVCECGLVFDEELTGAREHMIAAHLDLVETRYDDFLDDATEDPDNDLTDQELYDEAIDDVVDDMTDHIPE
jgi:hypothetical protein